MGRKLQIILFSLLAISVLVIGSSLPVYADDGKGPGNRGGQGSVPGGGGPPQGNSQGGKSQFGGPSDNGTGHKPPEPPSDNMTDHRPPDRPSDNTTDHRPPEPPSDNMTDHRPPEPPSDNMTDHRPPPPSDNLTDNLTGHRPPGYGGSDNNTGSVLDQLASILNIDKATLASALKQVFGDLFK